MTIASDPGLGMTPANSEAGGGTTPFMAPELLVPSRSASAEMMDHIPVTPYLADFGFMTIIHDPGLGMTSANSEVGGGTTPFMAPELLVPTKFGLDKCTPSKEADVYAMAMAVYQVCTTRCLAHAHIDPSRVGAHWNTTVR